MRFAVRTAVVAAVLALAPAGASLAQDAPGQRHHILFEDLPVPGATPSASAPSRAVARPDGATLAVPDGFRVNLFADGLAHARWLAVAPNGDVFLAEPGAGRVLVLRDEDGNGAADGASVFASGLDRPHGLAFDGGYVYVGTQRSVLRFSYADGDLQARSEPTVIGGVGALGAGGGHWTRNIAFSPDRSEFYVSVGSLGNVGDDPAPHATVQRFRADGSGQSTFASGLRNPVGIAFHPESGELYVVVNERDGFGDGLVPDFLTRVRAGEFFGWPYAYVGPHPAPGWGEQRPDLVEQTTPPDVMFEAHSAPLGLAFYDGAQFPVEYRGDAFVALHGSWNSSQPTGYKVVRVPFENGRPLGWYEDFATGFRLGTGVPARVFGRPVGVTVAADGSLLIADDVGQAIWRISYAPEG